MKIFETTDELAERIGIPLTPPVERDTQGGAGDELDWGQRLRGPGRPIGDRGGWVLTFARAHHGHTTGALIAYEIDENGSKTGQCALLRSPWDKDIDQREMDRAKGSDLWAKGAVVEPGVGEANLADIDSFIERA